MQLAWATDVHLNFCDASVVADFCARVRESGAHAVLLGGDIAEAVDLDETLFFLADRLELPIYFVLGNHDYYGSDVFSVRRRMRELRSPWLHWLPSAGVVELTGGTALVGHGGWGDARLGNPSLPVLLTDYFAIADLREASGENPLAVTESTQALRRKLHELGDEAANTLRPQLDDSTRRYAKVIVLTHVPPYRDSCWHEGKISNDDFLPGFTCKAMGDLLLEVVSARPECQVTVLCGHTHGRGEARMLPNLLVLTEAARYGRPNFRLLDVSG